jgi:hypothetical protein
VIVAYSARFVRQAEAAIQWCKEHGPPISIADEIEWLAEHTLRNPETWPLVANARTRGLRRAYLPAIGYHVYYRIDPRRGVIMFREFRHAKRRPVRV